MATNDKNRTTIEIKDDDVGTKMLDKLTRITNERRIKPLDKSDYIAYEHRMYYDEYCLRIGDCVFMIPPEFIMISSESTSQSIITLRQENTQKEKHGHHRRTLLIDLVFNGKDNINGFEVPAPVHPDGSGGTSNKYYVDGLRPLLAQFKCAPFLPISNILINKTYGIYAVALQSIIISTVNGFPNCLKAQIALQECNMMPYIEMPDMAFQELIDWDLFRYYYQSFMTEKHRYKRLQSLPKHNKFNRFKMSILNTAVFNEDKANSTNILDICIDKEIIIEGTDTNYTTWIDSDESDITVKEFQCSYTNILTNIQFSELSTPTIQYLGGLDTIFNIVFETTDETIIQSLEQCQTTNDLLIRNNPKIQGSIGFVKLDSELVEFTGSLFVMIDSMSINTVPGFPGLYNVQINCVAYDIAQSEKEKLQGFRPFDDTLGTGTGINQSATYNNQTINNNVEAGMLRKIKQDNYAEWKLSEMELYPDLRLPKYSEVNEMIENINRFRMDNNLTELPYTEYPTRPVSSIHGYDPASPPTIPAKDLVRVWEITSSPYDKYVDPDFYVFYPVSYNDLHNDGIFTNYTNPSEFESTEGNLTESDIEDLIKRGEVSQSQSGDARRIKFAQLCQTQTGCSYKTGAKGNQSDNKGLMFDDAGLISWALDKSGVNAGNISVDSIFTRTDVFTRVDISDARRGDVLIDATGHMGVYLGSEPDHEGIYGEGYGEVIHAADIDNGVVIEPVTRSNSAVWTYALRVNKFYQENTHEESYIRDKYSLILNELDSDEPTEEEKALSDNRYLDTEHANKIVDIVMSATQGENDDARLAMVQMIYDKATSSKYDDISDALNEVDALYTKTENDGTSFIEETVEREKILEIVQDVFCNNKKMWKHRIVASIQQSNPTSEYDRYDTMYGRLGEAGNHLFWGDGLESSTDKFIIVEDVDSLRQSIKQQQAKRKSITIDIADDFGEPILLKTNKCNARSGESRDWYAKTVNSEYNRVNSSFHDQYQYSCRGRLVRAFPTFLFCILDDDAMWYDGKKLWTNYYTHKAVVDIQIHGSYDMPTETATILVTNTYHTLDQLQSGIKKYNLYNDKELSAFEKWSYQNFGLAIGSGARLTSTMIQLHQVIYTQARIREGVRVHLRMGYGSDPLSLAPMINGTVTDCTVGDQISLVVTSDGSELIASELSSEENDTNSGWLGLFGFGETKHASAMIADIMCARQSAVSYLNTEWAEASLYSIEHYGLYFGQGLLKTSEATKQRRRDDDAYATELYRNIPIIGDALNAIGFLGRRAIDLVGDTANSIARVGIGAAEWLPFSPKAWYNYYRIASGESARTPESLDIDIADLWNGYSEQWDLLMNIYKGDLQTDFLNERNNLYNRYLYIYPGVNLYSGNEETDLTFDRFNMTPWDVFQLCAQNVPEFIIKSTYYQFDSRLYFGMPTFIERFRYDYFGGKNTNNMNYVYQEAKAAAQAHYISSIDSIIDNQIRVSSKSTYTNVKVMYVSGHSTYSTTLLHSDASIDTSKQKTKIIDSPICQNYLGPDWVYTNVFQMKTAENAAKRIGTSSLIYGWQNQYQGQIICTGQPGVKPYDYILLNDTYAEIFGVCICREVVHSFSSNTGFCTSITPGMIAISTQEQTGILPYLKIYLKILSLFAKYSYSRKETYITYESLLNTLSDTYVANEAMAIVLQDSKLSNTVYNVSNNLSLVTNLAILGQGICQFHDVLKSVKNIAKMFTRLREAWNTLGEANALREAWRAFREAKISFQTVRTLFSSAKAFVTAAAASAGATGVGIPIALIVEIAAFVIIDLILPAIAEYFDSRQCVALLPLWREGYPFVTNVKDGKNILLIPSNVTSTDDNTNNIQTRRAEGYE